MHPDRYARLDLSHEHNAATRDQTRARDNAASASDTIVPDSQPNARQDADASQNSNSNGNSPNARTSPARTSPKQLTSQAKNSLQAWLNSQK